MRFSARAFAIGLLFAAFFAYLATVACNRQNLYEPAAQIAAVSLLFCLALAVAVNPCLRLLRFSPLTRGELYLIFILTTIPAGLPVFGYVCNVIPFAGGLHLYENNWNTSQSEWDDKITPYVDPDFFVGHAVFSPRDIANWPAFVRALADPGAPPLLRYIVAGLPAEERQKLSAAATAGEVTEEDRLSLAKALRHALTNRDLIPGEVLAAADLPPLARELAGRARASLSGDEVDALNRLALESACAWVKPIDFAAGREANRLYYRGLRVSGREAFPAFIKKEDETFAAFGDRLRRAFRRDPSLRPEDIRDWPGLMRCLAEPSSSEVAIIANFLSQDSRAALRQWHSEFQALAAAERSPERGLAAALEAMESDVDLYEASYFAGVSSPPTIKELLARPPRELSDKEIRLRNRHLLAAACGGPGIDIQRTATCLAAAAEGKPSPAKRVWERLPEGARQTARAAVALATATDEIKPKILAGLNDILSSPLHSDAVAQRLLVAAAETSTVSAANKARLNRLILERALPQFIRPYHLPFWGEIPWQPWLRPLFSWFWLALMVCMFFYTLNELLFRQWYEREKLIFPIAQFTSLVLGDEESGGRVPAMFRTLSFWIGFAIAFGIDLYNGMVSAHWIEGLPYIDLDGNIDRKLEGTALGGLCYGFRLHIFFACIGLAFLLPTEISFSVWFFFALMKAQQLAAVWLGHGTDSGSFPSNWIDSTNFMRAQGGGAMIVFGLICLWRVRRNFLAFFYRLWKPTGSPEFTAEEVRAYTAPSALFFLSSAFILVFLVRGDVPWAMALFTYLTLLLLTISLVRLVAECGLIGFQAWFGPVHLFKVLGLLKWTPWFLAKGMATVVLFLASQFLDIKSFIAPYMMNGRYLTAKAGLSRLSFSGAVFIGIIVTLAISAITALALVYDKGLASMNGWFFWGFPQSTFASMTNIQTQIDTYARITGMAGWFAGGAAFCGLLIYLRQFLFWVPHPIGLVMYINPIMGAYWFSFFLAWLAKAAAVKYLDADGYKAARNAFMGLIIGEVVAVGAAYLLAVLGYGNMGLTFNRN